MYNNYYIPDKLAVVLVVIITTAGWLLVTAGWLPVNLVSLMVTEI